ncbi:TPA: fibronectin-binding domain-containing protein [Staphylococcus pseudintermedius]|uniref:Rqc2 family fibronectin-binding protein n=1 Tax=Staphylococcus pseudintermedius TaxID=283734 RepID=UPI0019D824D0|nr:NFACT family protein [Staphylococcus pseudintermedius]EGQ3102429.1 fibronectin-binding domain-containing protein [Staphylococcus pseudintermedius]EJD5745455.1 NFACT family protein [Staphylococcus pseudintermedius]HAR6084970.1 fibronectin-binding domain-containing protein [Staphylococcus pseudintermedius]HAR6111291.1 fibronectin-binding domain-containing protein [Staphylococcus pseudintermedius]HAR6269794.1 fibronectin-binding domain-containing protein [Staphylococcus pseudintermedius]
MAFDGMFTRKMVEDLQFLVSGRIHKINQPENDTIIMVIRQQRQNHQLLLSIHPNFARIHLTTKKYDNPFEPPMFARVFRKHLEGGRILAIRQIGNDRRIEMDVESKDEIGDTIHRTVILEIMGKHSNLILVNEERKILEGFKHLTPNTNQFRTVMPGFQYEVPPTQHKQNPYAYTGAQVLQHIDFNAGKIDRQLLQTFEGFSPLITKEITSRRHFMTTQTLPEAFDEVMAETKAIPQPVFHKNHETGKEDFYFMKLHQFYDDCVTYDSLHELLDRFYDARGERERVKQRANDLVKLVQQLLQKYQNKLSKLVDEQAGTEEKENQQLYGELITANIYQLKPGARQLETMNYYTGENVTIPLNPQKSPAENAQYYYKQYNRMKTRERELTHQITLTEENIAYFENIEQQLSHIQVHEIDDIREELAEQGFIKQKKQQKKKKQQKIQLQSYVSTDGDTILVGKNNKQNDYLTNKRAQKSHLWFHTKDIPGSHVVILNDAPSDKTIEEAAMIAAYFSKAGQSGQIPVDYTIIRNVHKPSGSKPGFITYDNQKTLYATPDYDMIRRLKAEEA